MVGGTDISREHLEIFIAEAEEQIDIWETSALALEKDPKSTEQLDALYRAVHTIKGSAGFVGCDELTALAHELETTVQLVREEKQEMCKEKMSILFEGLDMTKLCIASMSDDRIPEINYDAFIEKIKMSNSGILQSTPEPLPESEALPSVSVSESGSENLRTYVLDVEITADENEAYLRGLLIQSKLEDVGEILLIDPSLEDLRISEDGFRFRITVKTELSPGALKKEADIDQVSITLVDNDAPIEEDQRETVAAQPSVVEKKISPKPKKIDEVVRVHVNKLDSMMNLVGELVVANSRFVSLLNEGRSQHGDLKILRDLEERTDSLSQIARNLQDTVMKVSILPVATIFSRFHRVVRDLAKHSDKDINLEIFGEKTEIDKRIMDGISEPLIHLLRNAVDHGIEKKHDRIAFGKDGAGNIRIGAYQEGDRICVTLADDGMGIDRQAVVRKAMDKGLLSKQNAAGMTDREVLDLLFLPGFSTASEVTDISGRGMGLDIVKKTVEELGGSIRIESTSGLGTTTTITLPLTTAIINALVVESAGEIYAFPMSAVIEMIRPLRSELQRIQASTVLSLRDEVIAVLDLATVLWPDSEKDETKEKEDNQVTVIILDYDGRKIGMAVDHLVGKQEIVVKSLSKNYRDTVGLIGATIMGNGRVALILDINATLDAHYKGRADEMLPLNNLGDGDVRRPLDEPDGLQTPIIPEAPEPAAIVEVAEAQYVAEQLEEPEEIHVTETMDVSEVEETTDSFVPPQKIKTAKKISDTSQSAEDERLYLLNDLEIERMQEIMIDGAINASQSMTELLGHEVSISFPDLRIVPLERITDSFGGDEAPIAGIFVEFDGDVTGGWVIVMEIDELKNISDFLLGRPAGSTENISETEISALKEMGNILTASFIRSIAEATDLDIRLMVPELSIDMCLAVVDSVMVRFNRPGRHVMLTEAEIFSMATKRGICQLLILLEHESTARLLQILTREVSGLYEKASLLRRRSLSERESAGEWR